MSKQLLDLLKKGQWGDYEQQDADIARQALRELNVSPESDRVRYALEEISDQIRTSN